MASKFDRRTFLAQAALTAAGTLGPYRAHAARDGAPPLSEIVPFQLPASSSLRKSERKVVSHWHVFARSLDNGYYPHDLYNTSYMTPQGLGGKYTAAGGFILERPLPRPRIMKKEWLEEDMLTDAREAHAIGIDAFQFNIMWIAEDYIFWKYFLAMQNAILKSQIDFRLLVNFDCITKPSDKILENYPKAITEAFRRGGLMTTDDGRLILSAFMAEGWPATFWKSILDAFRANGVDVYFVPMYLTITKATPEHLALTDMVSCWTGNHLASIADFAAYGRASAAKGLPWMAPIFPQDCRPKDAWYAEADGSTVFRAGWMAAIQSGAAMADVVTWNDYSESSEIRPSTGIQYGYYDLAAYYIAWYKTGTPPPIVRDALYYFHRVESTDGPDLGLFQPKPMTMKYGPGPVNQIELLGFLTDAGTLRIITSAGTVEQKMPAGLQRITAPLSPGRPRFQLLREGKSVIDLESAFTVRTKSNYQDLLYRSGSSNREPVEGLAVGRA